MAAILDFLSTIRKINVCKEPLNDYIPTVVVLSDLQFFFNILPMDFLKVMSLHGGAIQRKFLPSSVDREKKGGSVKSSRIKTMHEK
jgi:hypothetical protein